MSPVRNNIPVDQGVGGPRASGLLAASSFPFQKHNSITGWPKYASGEYLKDEHLFQ